MSTPDKTGKQSNKMWGGRFAAELDQLMTEINASIDVDKRLYAQDITCSRAHAAMLVAQGILTAEDGNAIDKGLEAILHEIEDGKFTFSKDLEDIHMNVEARLAEIIGPAAGRLHTARSRNDQVATDFRLWTRQTIDDLVQEIDDLMHVILDQASAHADTIMPGFTHLQSAQPVTFGHHLLAYMEMFARDRSRFVDCRNRLNECPLGTAALAGTSFPIDRDLTAHTLGFDRPTANSLDSVSDRDFVLETLNDAAICAIHLSRLAEEIVIWSSAQFGFISLSDRFTTGSSIMPQKRNPDAAELIRAKAGRIFGAQTALQNVMKALPLTYSKDMQEDKEIAFDAIDTLALSLQVMTGMIRDMIANKDAMYKAAGLGFSTATDIADWLVRVLNIPFRQAHHITGSLVALAESRTCNLEDLKLEDMQQFHPDITEDIFDVLGLENSVRSRRSYGGTSPENVEKQVARWQEILK
ncbi:MAG: argininosuccinate lyase [Alphaproteobacteria bacterium]|nr:MAG: argininosuccinate lyase [Alphaproteobacteria bacterium]